MGQPEVKPWSSAVNAAGRAVAFRVDTSRERRNCLEVTLYEDVGPYLTRFGTWLVCGEQVERIPDD